MGHNTARKGYDKLVERLNKFPQGVPPSETLYKILNVMFSKEEARLVSLLPIRPFTVEIASKAWKVSRICRQIYWLWAVPDESAVRSRYSI